MTLAVAMLLLLVSRFEEGQLIAVMQQVKPIFLLFSLIAFMAMNFVRGIRFALLTRSKVSLLVWWRVAMLHMFFVTVVPFRLGELTFLPLAKQLTADGYQVSVPVMVISRIFDLFILVLIFLVSALVIELSDTLPMMLFLAVCSVGLILGSGQIVELVSKVLNMAAERSDNASIQSLASRVLSTCDWMAQNPLPVRSVFLLSILASCFGLISFYFVFRSYGLVLDPWSLMFLFSGMLFISTLGFFSVASIGVAEAGLAGLLMVLGFAPASALVLGVLVRLTMVGVNLVGTSIHEATTYMARAANTPKNPSG